MIDKNLAILGLVVVALFAIYQGAEASFPLVNTIVAAIAGFVTGTSYKAPKDSAPKEQVTE